MAIDNGFPSIVVWGHQVGKGINGKVSWGLLQDFTVTDPYGSVQVTSEPGLYKRRNRLHTTLWKSVHRWLGYYTVFCVPQHPSCALSPPCEAETFLSSWVLLWVSFYVTWRKFTLVQFVCLFSRSQQVQALRKFQPLLLSQSLGWMGRLGLGHFFSAQPALKGIAHSNVIFGSNQCLLTGFCPIFWFLLLCPTKSGLQQ